MTARSILAALLFVMTTAGPAWSQVPHIMVYPTGTYDQGHIGCYPPGTLTHLYVVLHNWTLPFAGVDFSIEYPPYLVWLMDRLPYTDGTVTIGTSPQGIAIAWGTCCMPDPMAGPVLLLTPMVLATYGCNCEGGGVRVRGYAPLGKAWPSVVTYPDFKEYPVYGSDTSTCRPVAVESTTWGAVKALYRN